MPNQESNNRQEVSQDANVSVQIQRQSIISSPLPPPEMLRQYDLIVEGGAEKIVQMAIDEQKHRHLIEKRKYNIKLLGQGMAFASLFILVVFSGYLAWLGHAQAASTTVIATVVAVVGTFVSGQYFQQKQSDDE